MHDKPIKILVTGLNSLIGWNVFQMLREHYDTVGTYAKEQDGFSDDQCFRVDLDDLNQVKAFIGEVCPNYVVHTRGICDMDLCEEMPKMAHQINVQGTEKLLQALAGHSLKKFVYLSTDHVFDGEKGFYSEEDEPCPKHVYGQTKWETEKIIKQLQCPWLIIRPGLAVGRSVQGNKGPRDFLFSRIRAGKPTHLFTDEWRSPVCVERLAKKVIKLMLAPAHGIYHIADVERISRFELGHKLAKEHGLPTQHIFPRLREEDAWAHMRPKDISLRSVKKIG